MIMLFASSLTAQTLWPYDFGTGSTSYTTANSSSTTFMPNQPAGGGTHHVFMANGGGGFYRDDPGLANFGSGAELRLAAPTTSGSNNINKYSVYNYTRQRNAYHRYKFRLGSSNGGFADSGTFYYFFGDGASFETNTVATNAETVVGIRWVLGTNGSVTTSYLSNGTWTTVQGVTFAQGVNYTLEFRIHNGPGAAGGGRTYVYNGTTYTTTIYTYDMWVNGVRIAGLPNSGGGTNTWLDSYMFYAESSTGNVGNLFLDDMNTSNAIDVVASPIYYSKSTGTLDVLATWGTNTDGTGTAPLNFTTPNIGYYIRNNPSPTLAANWAVTGSGSVVELGDGVNACTFTIPSNFTYQGPIDVLNLGILNIQNTVYPSFGIMNNGSTVRYSSSTNQTVQGYAYYNLSIQGGGTKTLGDNTFVANLIDVGDGSTPVTFTHPVSYTLTGTVNVLNQGTLDLQNTVHPTLGTLSSGSTVRFSGTTNQDVPGVAYHNLVAYGTGIKTLTGNATLGGSGTVGDGSNSVTLRVPAAYSLTGVVNVNNYGTLEIESTTLPTLGTLATGSTVRYTYPGNQNVTGTTYYNMDVDNGFTKTMQNDVTVTNLSFSNAGTLALNGYNLYLAGKDISFYSTNTVFSDLAVSLANAQIAGMSINRVWTTSGSFANPVNVTFRYPDTESSSTTVGVWYKGDAGIWTKLGSYSAVASGGYMYVTVSGLNSIGTGAKGPLKWTIAEDIDTLPVELSSFTAGFSAQNYVTLQWTTQSETNVSGYRIYRGLDAELQNAEMLNTFIEATNTSQLQVYVYWDKDVTDDGTYYYWLQNVDFDGSSQFHGPVSITVNLTEGGTPAVPIRNGITNAYPNPFNPSTSIEFGVLRAGNTSIDVFNVRGQHVRRLFNGMREAGVYTLRWDGTDDSGLPLPSGIYSIRMSGNGTASVRKVMLMK